MESLLLYFWLPGKLVECKTILLLKCLFFGCWPAIGHILHGFDCLSHNDELPSQPPQLEQISLNWLSQNPN